MVWEAYGKRVPLLGIPGEIPNKIRPRETWEHYNLWCAHGNKDWFISGWYMGVSKNRSTPKSSILIGFSLINHPFWGYHYFWKHPFPSYTRVIVMLSTYVKLTQDTIEVDMLHQEKHTHMKFAILYLLWYCLLYGNSKKLCFSFFVSSVMYFNVGNKRISKGKVPKTTISQ